MVKLADSDIKTREVLEWKGLHLFHTALSSCSQKLRIYLALKGLDWEGHNISLRDNENLTEWFLGINTRGLLPVLVDDGDVHIESNDIISYLERKHPDPRLIPEGMEDKVDAMLRHEDDLHLDLRTLSFRFVFNQSEEPKTAEDLERYATAGSGTVGGEADTHRAVEIDFWRNYAANGIGDERVREAVDKFRAAFDELEEMLADRPYLLGHDLSVLDIAWFIYANRLTLANYPFARLHPRVADWFERLRARPEFVREIELPARMQDIFEKSQARDRAAGTTLEQVAAL